ncbi:MAG: hypothetical protein J6B54_01735 [Clostridia bacterium]|nr:hypothetical protein [Clostridia bacterium]
MNSKQNPLWIVVGAVACGAVAVAVLACLPSWSGMGDLSALEAIVETVKRWMGL